jgi:hypothetical protein
MTQYSMQILEESVKNLKESVDKIHLTLFGIDNKSGLVHKIDAILKVADAIKWILNKIFLAICLAISIPLLTKLLAWAAKLLENG